MRRLQFRSIGECMGELQLAQNGAYTLAFGGDTLNTSWYARALTASSAFDVEYVTALGRDPLSRKLLGFLVEHGIGTRFARSIAERDLGLYLITLAGAERSFTYWRNNSAAKLLAADPEHLASALSGADVIYFSGITLAIISSDDRKTLFSQLQKCRANGASIAFDSNVRPRLWPTEQEMREAIIQGYRAATIALPTFPDEQTLFGDATASACAGRISSYGVEEVIVKNGVDACYCLVGGERFEIAPSPVTGVIDTTGAGDSFNAGYLVGRMAKMECSKAVNLAHRVAARVICQRGALAPMSIFADLAVS